MIYIVNRCSLLVYCNGRWAKGGDAILILILIYDALFDDDDMLC